MCIARQETASAQKREERYHSRPAGSTRVTIRKHSFVRFYGYRETKRLDREPEGGWMSIVRHQIDRRKEMLGVRRFSVNELGEKSLLGILVDAWMYAKGVEREQLLAHSSYSIL